MGGDPTIYEFIALPNADNNGYDLEFGKEHEGLTGIEPGDHIVLINSRRYLFEEKTFNQIFEPV
jgi:hypothetical protein